MNSNTGNQKRSRPEESIDDLPETKKKRKTIYLSSGSELPVQLINAENDSKDTNNDKVKTPLGSKMMKIINTSAGPTKVIRIVKAAQTKSLLKPVTVESSSPEKGAEKSSKARHQEYCTFSHTGEVGIEQKLYNCVTCNMQDGHCICEICIYNCHEGHTVVFSEEDAEGFCDCGEQGSRGIRSCNMLKVKGVNDNDEVDKMGAQEEIENSKAVNHRLEAIANRSIMLGKQKSAPSRTVRLKFGSLEVFPKTQSTPIQKTKTVSKSSIDAIDPKTGDVKYVDPADNHRICDTENDDYQETSQSVAIDENLCTFLSNDTILSRSKEDWFHCHTCGFGENEGICSVCVKTCHLNHKVTYADYSKFLCDCGSQGEEQCRALTSGRNLKDDHPDQNESPDVNTDTFALVEGEDEGIDPKIDSVKDKASNSAALERKVWGDSRATVKTELFMNGAPVTREILEEHENTPIKVYIKIEASSLKDGSLLNPPKKLYIVSDSPHANRALQTEVNFRSICGIPRWLFLNTLEKLDHVLLLSKVLSSADQLVFYFMKLKGSLDFTILAFIFDCDVKELEEIFTDILDAHHRIASQKNFWKTKSEIRSLLPDIFMPNHSKARGILNFSEIQLTHSSSEVAKNLTSASYDTNDTTARWLTVFDPSGLVTFMSKVYQDTSDIQVFKKCGILHLMQTEDIIFAPNCLPKAIENQLQARGLDLVNLPKSNHQEQFELKNPKNADLKDICKHTEQVTQRLNTFKILRSIEKPSFQHMDKILVVIGNIINQFGPVIDSNTGNTETIAVRLPDHDY